ncbi:hypothetical protein NUU61_005817 [Penicillium alfredii]|uniref:Uncharacterized protein n=1 Tax=Penicillium alfredii TaxID=1506179 RepID=A0A9W9FAC0_9EURO|nr:uncharacterized protein NUU61_005817 [Penicillium alfredii]KAJ5096461.1 hypothetical protein NUU61_005817 [Penicillium alfredii]
MKLTTSRYLDGGVYAYQVSGSVDGPLEPIAIYPVKSEDEILNHAVAPNLDRATYATRHNVVCIDHDGSGIWRYSLEPRSARSSGHSPSCVFSLDGNLVWVYRPDAMADRGPDMLVVGEGQDGVRFYRASLTGDDMNLHPYEWIDRFLIDVAPDGQSFMTVDHGREDVAFHVFPSGEVISHLSVDDFGYEYGESFMDWSGGFLDADRVIVSIVGETDNQEWHHHHSIDLRTGILLGRLEAHSRDSYDFEALGDGTWIVSDPGGKPVRYRLSN